jgi:UDP-sugar pyrophosphorylase
MPTPSFLTEHQAAGIISTADLQLAEALLAEDQGQLFADWDTPGTRDDEKRAFFQTLHNCNRSYPGGLVAYIRNARRLLAESATGANPFAGYSPEEPDLVDLSGFGPAYEEAEGAGLKSLAETAIVLVAGGLGERLGYHGIKLDIPVEVTETTTYLAHYTAVILAASKRLGREIPLVIMTSRETNAGTLATLEANKNFGLAPGQITILNQELVPALADIDAHLSLEEKYRLNLKPHGHGDIHTLLHTSGTAKKFAATGICHLLFIQDTNGQVFNAALAALGVSEIRGYDFNSIAVNRIPGEAVGGIARLKKPGAPDLTLNVEYNHLDPLLRETVNPAGDVAEPNGFSRFPGNINLLVVRLEPYLRVLESSGGVIAEFVNPKFADASRTRFKKPARLETLMQDLPKSFVSGEKVGVTIFDRVWCFSACKNNLADAAAKVASNGPPESASSAENDFYLAGRMKLRAAGMEVLDAPQKKLCGIPITPGPRVILRPSFALTLSDVRARISGGSISGEATLVLDGDVSLSKVSIADGASLVAKASEGESLHIQDRSIERGGLVHDLVPLTEAEMSSTEIPEPLRIRGYRIVARKA